MDYAIPRRRRAGGHHREDAHVLTAQSSRAKGLGEAGCIAIPPALVNAAVDALAPFGVTHVDMPLTAEKRWRLMRS